MAKATSVVMTKKDTKFSKSHSAALPPYFQMIVEAISKLKDQNGSSQPAIAKAIEEMHKNQLPSNFKSTLADQLKKLVESKKLVKVKNSYKLSETPKKSVRKGKKMKRLSQVNTPEGMKKKSKAKTPEGLKRKISKPVGSSRPKKMAKK